MKNFYVLDGWDTYAEVKFFELAIAVSYHPSLNHGLDLDEVDLSRKLG